mgnify:FL=1
MNKWPYLLWIFVVIGLCASQQGSAESGGPDSFGYTFKDSNETGGPTYNWIDISSNGTSFNLHGDSGRGPYDIGFDFFFYGEWYSQWYLGGDNGYVTLGSVVNQRWTPHPIPTTELGAAIAPFWRDHRGTCDNEIYANLSYKKFGNSNNRTLVIQYDNLRDYGSCGSDHYGLYNFQIILFEKTGDILFQYNNNFSNGGSDYNGTVGMGIQNSGEVGLQYYYGGMKELDSQFSVRFYAPPIPQNDLLVSELKYDSYFSLNYNETVTAVIRNIGVENQTNFNVSFELFNDDGAVFYTHTKNIDFLERYNNALEVKFIAPILMDLEFENNDNITISVSLLISDENMSNNKIHSETAIKYLIFKENFEEGTLEDSGWDFSESQAWNYTNDASGNRSMFSGYRCSQNNPARTSITSPSFNLNVGYDIYLKFSHSYYSYHNYEGTFLEIDMGQGFTIITPENSYPGSVGSQSYYGNPIKGNVAWTDYSNYGGYQSDWVYGTSPSEVVFDLSSSIDAKKDYSNVKLRWTTGFSSLSCGTAGYDGGYGFDNVVIFGELKKYDVEIIKIESKDLIPINSLYGPNDIENEVDTLVVNQNGFLNLTLRNKGFADLNLDNITFKLEIWKLDEDGVYFLEHENIVMAAGTLHLGEKNNVLIDYNIDLAHRYQFGIFANYEIDQNDENNQIYFNVLENKLAYNSNHWLGWTNFCQNSVCSSEEIQEKSNWKLVNGSWITGNDTLRTTYNGDDYSIMSPTFDLSGASSNIYILLEHAYFFEQYDGGRVEMCFEVTTYLNDYQCNVVTPTFNGYEGQIFESGYYGNPLSGSEGFISSSGGIKYTTVTIEKETIPQAYINDIKFRFRMGGAYFDSDSSWTIYNLSLYSNGKEIEGTSITAPKSTFITSNFSIVVNYTNNGNENIDFGYLQASIYNISNGVSLISHKTITNLHVKESIEITFDYDNQNIPLVSNETTFEIAIELLNRSSEYSSSIIDSCSVEEFTISPSRHYIYHPNDSMSFYCSDKMIPYNDLIVGNNILKTEIVFINKPPTISLLEQSKTLLKNQNYTFVQHNSEINDKLFVTSYDDDGYIQKYKWKSSQWDSGWGSLYCSQDCSTESIASFGLGPYHSQYQFLGLDSGFHIITIYAIDNHGTISSNFVEFNVTILADTDRDGIPDIEDFFPTDAAEWVDSDSDGVGDNSDVFPNDISEWNDNDRDGVGNNADQCPDYDGFIDVDGDGYCEKQDACPNDPNSWRDFDSDNVCDILDAFPLNGLEWEDSDGDGYGDNGDTFPNDINEWSDLDGDGVGDNSDVMPNNRFLTAGWQVGALMLFLFAAFISSSHAYGLYRSSSRVTNKLDETRILINRLKEKGVNTDSLENAVEEVEEKMKEWILR